MAKKKVYWDKGHGGTDPGAVGNGLQEKVLTSKIVNYAMAYLNDYDVDQRTSRAADETKSLAERSRDANNWGADLLVSVHINSAGNVTASGFECFTYNNASAASIAFQNIIHPEIYNIMKAFGIDKDRGKKRADFHMVREPKCPAVLTENLFISNTYDANRLRDDVFLKAVGEAHARGVVKFLGLAKKHPVVTGKSGWVFEKGEWYFYENGTMLKNAWAKDKSGRWYYLSADGTMMEHNWAKWKGEYYFLGADGAMVANNWVRWKNKWYYMLADGKMAKGSKVKVGGKEYELRDDGSMVLTNPSGVVQE